MPESSADRGPRAPGPVRLLAAHLVGALPLLAVMAVPALMRSRAGSQTLLGFGVLIYLGALAWAVWFSPRVNASVAPVPSRWTPATAIARASGRRRAAPRRYWLRIGGVAAAYAAAQLVGWAISAAVPHVHDNPAFGTDPGAARWVIDYGAYALQAAAMYVVICAGIAWFAAGIRSDVLGAD